MRVLYLSPRICWPLHSGAHLRDFHLARNISLVAKLTYVALENRGKQPAGTLTRIPLGSLTDVDVWNIERRPSYRITDVARGLTGPTPITILNFRSAAALVQLEHILRREHFDAVQFEGVHLFAYARRIRQIAPETRLVCDWHNLESEILIRYAALQRNWMRRLYATRTAALVHRMEDRLLEFCDLHLVCSEREGDILRSRSPSAPIEIVRNGVDSVHFAASTTGSRTRSDLLFVGRMDYHANVDAILSFVRRVWPLIRLQRPELRLMVIGANPDPEILALRRAPNIEVVGAVDDVRPYYDKALAALAPLRIGGGTRLKILEAMAAGVPVISTTLGAEGLEATPGREIIVADSADAYAGAVASLSAFSSQWRRLADNGRTLAKTKYDWSVIGRKLSGIYGDELAVQPRHRITRPSALAG